VSDPIRYLTDFQLDLIRWIPEQIMNRFGAETMREAAGELRRAADRLDAQATEHESWAPLPD
jgi:hypothetical protein